MWPDFARDLSGQSGSDLGIFGIFWRRIEGGVARECWTQENNLHHWHNQCSFWQGTILMHLLMQRCALDFFSLLRLHEPVMQRVQLIRKRHSCSAHLRFGNKPPAGRSGIRWVGKTGSEPILVVVGGSRRRHLLFNDLCSLRIERFPTRKFGRFLWAICYGYLYSLMPPPRFSNPLPGYILVIAET